MLILGEKVKILFTLTSQLLTFAACRDHIEDCAEKLKQVQRNLRLHQLKESRRERDETQYWYVIIQYVLFMIDNCYVVTARHTSACFI